MSLATYQSNGTNTTLSTCWMLIYHVRCWRRNSMSVLLLHHPMWHRWSSWKLWRTLFRESLTVKHIQETDWYALLHSKCIESGVTAWDCKYQEDFILCPYSFSLAGDNPMQAEECSHAGLRCNYFCRTCNISGSTMFNESDEGYASIFKVRFTSLLSKFVMPFTFLVSLVFLTTVMRQQSIFWSSYDYLLSQVAPRKSSRLQPPLASRTHQPWPLSTMYWIWVSSWGDLRLASWRCQSKKSVPS